MVLNNSGRLHRTYPIFHPRFINMNEARDILWKKIFVFGADHASLLIDFGMSSSYNDLIASSGTSCAVSQDKSAYWTPALYFIGVDGKTELVEQVGGMLA